MREILCKLWWEVIFDGSDFGLLSGFGHSDFGIQLRLCNRICLLIVEGLAMQIRSHHSKNYEINSLYLYRHRHPASRSARLN